MTFARKIRAIGFDLGDTLIFYRDTPLSWVALYPAALKAVASACGTSPASEQIVTAEQILSRYNTRLTPRVKEVSAAKIMSQILRTWELDPSQHLSAAIEAYFAFFQQKMCAYPDAIPTLSSLRERGVLTGILTDVPYGMPREFVQRDLDDAGISGLFEAVLASVEVGVRKPETDGYLALATRLGVTPAEMLFVGNEPKDVIGACRAGMTAVFLDRSGAGGNHGQHFTIATLSAIPEVAQLAPLGINQAKQWIQ